MGEKGKKAKLYYYLLQQKQNKSAQEAVSREGWQLLKV